MRCISLKHRILSLAAAAVFALGTVFSCGVHVTAQASAEPAQMQQQAETVNVIVRVAGDAVLDQPDAVGTGADYLATAENVIASVWSAD